MLLFYWVQWVSDRFLSLSCCQATSWDDTRGLSLQKLVKWPNNFKSATFFFFKKKKNCLELILPLDLHQRVFRALPVSKLLKTSYCELLIHCPYPLLLIQACRGRGRAGAYPRSFQARARAHPEQVASPLQTQTTMRAHIQSSSQFRIIN